MRVPTNPLDVLAQHTVAACALEPLDADRWFDAVRRSAPFATLPRSAFEATLDLLSGKYPSTEFAELRPRLVYDRDSGTLTARPGAQRLAVTSGGAIPDRGLFTVYLASTRLRKAFASRRTRRGDGLRVAARRRHLAGRDELADHRDHPRPGAGHTRAGSSRRGCRSGAATASADRPNWAPPSVRSPANWPAWVATSSTERCRAMGFDDYATDNLWQLLDDQRTGHRHRCRPTPPWWWSGSATNSVTGG